MSLALRLARIPSALFAFRQVMMERETVEDQLMKLRQSEIDRFQAEQEAAELAAEAAEEAAAAAELLKKATAVSGFLPSGVSPEDASEAQVEAAKAALIERAEEVKDFFSIGVTPENATDVQVFEAEEEYLAMKRVQFQNILIQMGVTSYENATLEQVAAAEEKQKIEERAQAVSEYLPCLLYTSPSPRDLSTSRMPSSA